MKRLVVALAAISLAAPACAGSYRVVLQKPENGKLLFGHAGVQAADERNDEVLIRVISPGNQVKERGTVRVLVFNYGPKTFEFGPDQVKLRLADGTALQPTPLDKFDKGRAAIERGMREAHAVSLQNREALSALAEQTSSGSGSPSTPPGAPTSAPPGAGDLEGLQSSSSSIESAGAKLIESLDQLLVPVSVGPKEAWGGYYVFDVPKVVFERKTDQPLTVIVATGNETHEFPATLHWK